MTSWTRPLAGLTALLLLLSACGGAASPAPSTGGSAAPAGTGAPTASEGAPTIAPTDGAQGPDLSGAAAALEGLDSYHLVIAMKQQGLEDSLFSFLGDGLQMEGTIIFRPTEAADITLSMGTAAQKTDMGYRLIGEEAWVRLGDNWVTSTAEDARSTIDSFSPEKMLGGFTGVSGLTAVGEETRNGVETTHYAAPADAIGAALGESIGITDATWSMDFWVAKDAGYAVAYSVLGKGANASFEMTLDVSRINDPTNKVEKPASGG